MQLNHFLLVSCCVTMCVLTRNTLAQNVTADITTNLTGQAANTSGTPTEATNVLTGQAANTSGTPTEATNVLTGQAADTSGTPTKAKTNVNNPAAANPKAPVKINPVAQTTRASMQKKPMPSSTSHSIDLHSKSTYCLVLCFAALMAHLM